MAALAPIAICVAMSGAQLEASDTGVPLAKIPALADSAATLEGFVPRGWKIEKRLSADLDRDGQPDLIAVLQGQDAKCRVPAGATGPGETFDSNPRILMVALRRGARYVLQATNGGIITRRSDPYMDDPFENGGLTVAKDVMRLKLSSWRSAGGWETFTASYAFRWNGKTFALIGYDRDDLHRGSGETKQTSVNFLTGQAKVMTGSIEDDQPGPGRWKPLPRQIVPTLDSLPDGLDYEPKL